MRKTLFSVFIVALAATLLSYDTPKNWFVAGSVPTKYEMGLDKGRGRNGGNAATIKSSAKSISGFGTLMQQCSPKKYLGKKVKMTGLMKSDGVSDWAGFWMRVDAQGTNEPLAFDNMQDRAVKGTIDWKTYEIVLDVPDKAVNLAYGALLSGTGQIWFSDIRFEIIGNADGAGTTNMDASSTLDEPTNLDFKQ